MQFNQLQVPTLNSVTMCSMCPSGKRQTESQETTLANDVNIETDLRSKDYDGVILILYPKELNVEPPAKIADFIRNIATLDGKLHKGATLWYNERVAGGRLIVSSTGRITPYQDATVIKDAAANGMLRALEAGIKRPILIAQTVTDFPEGQLVAILGALEVLYVPLQMYERGARRSADKIGLYAQDEVTESFLDTIRNAIGLEQARIITRDIAGGDPERMCPANVVKYVNKIFANDSNISLEVIEDVKVIAKEYPLLSAVSRAVNNNERQKARIVELEYNPDNAAKVVETLILVGKGVCYDTGGADVKIGSKMRGMSRDKSGAAAVAGFIKACSILKPSHLKVIGVLCLCRNSFGSYSYVADELLVSRAGKTVRITNTDAEGRLAMADALTKAANLAFNAVNPHIYTIATLTGHASLCFGEYTVALDNHIARTVNQAIRLQISSSRISEGLEVSIMRQIDLTVNEGKCKGDDLSQFDPEAKGRNHQFAAGFLMKISGLDELDLKYTHLDIAGSCGMPPEEPTAAPLLTLCHAHKVVNMCQCGL